MKSLYVTAFLAVTLTPLYSQIRFEKGYFISNNGDSIQCLIKNVDWKNNPSTFQYKKSTEDLTFSTGSIEDVKEFSVGGSQFIRHQVNIDTSHSLFLERLSKRRAPEFSNKVLFLKVVVSGKASLFSYETADMKRFFFKYDTSKVQQLIYKQYRPTDTTIYLNGAYKHLDGSIVYDNNFYKYQLKVLENCTPELRTKIERADYQLQSLKKIFVTYNECSGASTLTAKKEKRGAVFHIGVRAGINSSTLRIESPYVKVSEQYERKITPRWSIEAEYTLPFHKRKWGILLEPTFQSYSAKGRLPYSKEDIMYKSWQIPLGIRHYFFLTDRSKLFLNALGLIDFPIASNAETLEINRSYGWALGGGYKYHERASIELRANTKRNILLDYVYWHSEFTTVSLVLGVYIK